MRYLQSRPYQFVIHRDAKKDLDDLFEKHKAIAAEILVFFEGLQNEQRSLDRLTSRGYCQYEPLAFDVDEWQETRRKKYNLWRIKPHWSASASSYRIIYAFDPKQYHYYVLAIVHRDFNYETKNPRVEQILRIYDSLDIPRV
jgi:mRNA-degrading endonuclease RelE of RelBE toxin-antitoxin system